MIGDRLALRAGVGAVRRWLSMLYIEPIYHRRLDLQKAASGPEIGVATAFGRSGCRCPPARIEDRHAKASPDARAAAMTSFVFPGQTPADEPPGFDPIVNRGSRDIEPLCRLFGTD